MANDATQERLAGHLRALAADYPHVWRQCESFYAMRGKDGLPIWPRWVFLPMGAAYAIASGGGSNRVPVSRAFDIARIHHLAAWRLTQGIYRFPADVFTAVAETEMGETPVPTDVLLRLPEWCVYLDFEGRLPGWHGVYVALEWDSNNGSRELRLLFDQEAEQLIPLALILIPDGSLWDALEAMIESGMRQMAKTPPPAKKEAEEVIADLPGLPPVVTAVNLALLLCAEQPAERKPEEFHPKPVTVKGSLRFFPPAKPTIYPVGEKIAERLQAAEATIRVTGDRQTIRPHIRRAHWHGYWHGPREGERRFVLQWLPPMVVSPREKTDGN